MIWFGLNSWNHEEFDVLSHEFETLPGLTYEQAQHAGLARTCEDHGLNLLLHYESGGIPSYALSLKLDVETLFQTFLGEPPEGKGTFFYTYDETWGIDLSVLHTVIDILGWKNPSIGFYVRRF